MAETTQLNATKSNAKQSNAKQSNAKQSNAKSRPATTADTTAQTGTSHAATALRARNRKVILTDSAYVLAGLGHDTVRFARGLPVRVRTLATREQLAQRIRDGRRSLDHRRTQLDGRLRLLRDRGQQRFDQQANEGRTVVAHLLDQEAVKEFLQQARAARSKVREAASALRKTADTTISAGIPAAREQAATAKSQVRAAAASIRKTGAAAAEAGEELVS